ncbi:hypothetical protein K2173_007391 [Erythroxylum novogranatense]|uniref:Uncharacterized protein n=1 Tax=Erythroxylum novogranatense TaxID=1862640 RepID=A0AAV8T646_9ROSI|nr:hypothetical protein K2173_007391 [Erythroxylum novogranatense]
MVLLQASASEDAPEVHRFNGHIRPVKLSSLLQRPQVLPPLLDLENVNREEEEFEKQEEEEEESRGCVSVNEVEWQLCLAMVVDDEGCYVAVKGKCELKWGLRRECSEKPTV